MKVYVYTLGCRLNQCESEALSDSFKKEGFEILKESKDAELIIVNTCAVTSKAEQKARRMIRLFSQAAKCVIVTGCYGEKDRERLESIGENVVVFSLDKKASLLKLASVINENDILSSVKNFESERVSSFAYNPTSFSYHSRAYLKVQDGCDNSCGYCKTTIVRGPSRWLDADECVKRVLELESKGMREIMLTGVNLTNYDHSGRGLGGLLEKILGAAGENIRFRLSSMEPDHVDELLLSQIEDYRIFPHFHIPIQSASNNVLKIVGRNYSIEHVEYIIERLRRIKNDPFISCDVIAGLPGEREEDFLLTYDFLERNEFSQLHVFPYSPREGTPLFNSRLKVEERVRDERAERLRNLSTRLNRKYLERQIGKEEEIIAEKNGVGTTGNYLKAKIIEKDIPIKEGELYRGIVTSIFPLEFSLV